MPKVLEDGRGGDNTTVEMAAMKVAMDYEQAQGRTPEDVSKTGVGCDVRSVAPDGSVRYIEVKGHAATGDITLYYTEWQLAHRMRDEFFIYEVDYALTTPELRIVQDPIGKGVPAKESVIEYRINAADLRAAAEPAAAAGRRDMSERRKRLIEVAFPLEKVSEHSRREKNVKPRAYLHAPHLVGAPPSGRLPRLHLRLTGGRPRHRCRARSTPPRGGGPRELGCRPPPREEWCDTEAEEDGSGLTGTQLLERAPASASSTATGASRPRLLDPFAGGGAIPLEGLRLGCEVEASDLNPVAVLILKGTVGVSAEGTDEPDSRPVPDYIREADAQGSQLNPSPGGELAEAYRRNPLATDVRYWGHWVLERARAGAGRSSTHPTPTAAFSVAYLWSRTIPCPSCRAEMPLSPPVLARPERQEESRPRTRASTATLTNSVDFKRR